VSDSGALVEPALELRNPRGEVALGRPVQELQLDPVRIVDEGGVVAGRVVVLLRAALDLGARLASPLREVAKQMWWMPTA
jgi:hypothetical protein